MVRLKFAPVKVTREPPSVTPKSGVMARRTGGAETGGFVGGRGGGERMAPLQLPSNCPAPPKPTKKKIGP